MAEVLFYHMTESTLDEALPALLEKTLQRGWRAAVQAGTEERRDALDAQLWSFRDDSFLAHGTDRDPYPEDQPVLLTTGPGNANGAAVRFIVDGAKAPDIAGYERAIFLFDGHDQQQIEAAREEWKALKAAGHDVTYWQQTPERRWEKRA